MYRFLIDPRRALRLGGISLATCVWLGLAGFSFGFAADKAPENSAADRNADGDGSVRVHGELKCWHKVTLDLQGPHASERDSSPNPFTDVRMTVTFRHADGTTFVVPGYFAADGDAADTSADAGIIWRAHLAPDRPGRWTYQIRFRTGKHAAVDDDDDANPLSPYDGTNGEFEVGPTDKSGRDLRAHGQLRYDGERYPRFAESGRYFLKAGADAPETLLAFADFDNTTAGNPKRAPLKTWQPHVRDWKPGDPTWGDGKGKGLIGAINYLSGKGCNAFSFLTYNAGGDGDNVWPFVERNDKLHYDCSKLDQWGVVFDHGTRTGMHLHFKMQETENDDSSAHQNRIVPESLDGGDLGVERKLYCRELIARFAHALALNWNLGEENTQSAQQQRAMIDYIRTLDPYDHSIVVHTFPNQQDKVYRRWLGDSTALTGVSLQNSRLGDTHAQTVKWVEASQQAGHPWIVAFDESGSAAHAQCPDLGYNGYDGRDKKGEMTHTQHDVRKLTLWGTLMGGGVGCEYYFGYRYDQNDLNCEDWRSRDQSWDYCRVALQFFHDHDIPFWEMQNADALVGNPNHGNDRYCMARAGDIYLVYLPDGGSSRLDLTGQTGRLSVQWFNPRDGGPLRDGSVTSVDAGGSVDLGQPPATADKDWLILVRRVGGQAAD